jgi:cytochrome c-type biogenesis protein
MGLWMGGFIALRLPSADRIPAGAGPFTVGVVFALVASPCASPILIAVLGAAAKDGTPLRSAAAMVVYAVGYTAILFTASLFAGIAMTSRRLLAYGTTITRLASVGLVLVGLATIWYGFRLL